jgi:hypothetical protein
MFDPHNPLSHWGTLGADKAYDVESFVGFYASGASCPHHRRRPRQQDRRRRRPP